MIKIYLLDFSGAEAAQNHLSALPDFVEKTKNKDLKRERAFSYMLLFYAYKMWKNSSDNPKNDNNCFQNSQYNMPNIERDENGRPYFLNENIDFNLSHDGNMAAVAISDEGAIGIDIQLCRDVVSPRLCEKVNGYYESKWLSALMAGADQLEDAVMTVYSSDQEISEVGCVSTLKTDGQDLFCRWASLEAIVKADGRGISGFRSIEAEKGLFTLRKAKVTDRAGKEYALSVALHFR